MKTLILIMILFSGVSFADEAQATPSLLTAQQAREKATLDNQERLEQDRTEFVQSVKKIIMDSVQVGNFKALVLVPKNMTSTFATLTRELQELGYQVKLYRKKNNGGYAEYSDNLIQEPGDQVYSVNW